MNWKKEKLLEILKHLPSATMPEVLNLLPNIIDGRLAISLSFIGNIVLNFNQIIETNGIKNDINELDENIKSLYKKINELDLKEQEKVLEEIKKVCATKIKHILYNRDVDIYTVDSMEIVLRYEVEDSNFIEETLLEEMKNEESVIYEFVDTLYFNDNKIVINLIEPKYKDNLYDFIGEIDNLIKDLFDTLWGRSLIKKIYFY